MEPTEDYNAIYKRNLVAMADACVRREMCCREIREKLQRRELPKGMIDTIVDELVRQRFIDEQRYAQAFVRDKLRFNGWGRRKIVMALKMKSIPDEVIREAMAQVDDAGEEYKEKLLEVAAAKAKRLNLEDIKDQAKLYRFLAGRGYSGDEISMAMRTMRKR